MSQTWLKTADSTYPLIIVTCKVFLPAHHMSFAALFFCDINVLCQLAALFSLCHSDFPKKQTLSISRFAWDAFILAVADDNGLYMP